jgi:hypothetical protein
MIPWSSAPSAGRTPTQTVVRVGVADRKIFGELRVRAEMTRIGWTVGGFHGPPAIGVAPLAPDASGCAE